MSFDISALSTFRNTGLTDADAIANIGEQKEIKQKGSYHGAFIAMFRTSSTKAANNAARTELLRSLGNAFGLEGIGRNAKGVTTFSKDFMDKLEKLLGADFKRGDFELDADGAVCSGKPLTNRRISAIVKRATVVSRGEYDYGTYKEKLAYVREQIAGLELKKDQDYLREPALKHFDLVEKLMDFVENELPQLFDENIDFDSQKPEGEGNRKYIYYTRIDGQLEEHPLESIGNITKYLQDKCGALVHIQENILGNGKLSAYLEDLQDPPKQIKEYLTRAITAFVTNSINIFVDAERVDKTKVYLQALHGLNPCVEGKNTGLDDFRAQNIPMEDAAATHDKEQPLNQCMGREIAFIMQKNPNVEEWKDVAAEVKKNLVGTIRPIDVAEKKVTKGADGEEVVEYKFKPLLAENGKPVIRAITEADIDALGEAVMETILFG